MYFHTVISVFRTSIYAVFVIDRTQKQTLLTSRLNIQVVKAEKEE